MEFVGCGSQHINQSSKVDTKLGIMIITGFWKALTGTDLFFELGAVICIHFMLPQ